METTDSWAERPSREACLNTLQFSSFRHRQVQQGPLSLDSSSVPRDRERGPAWTSPRTGKEPQDAEPLPTPNQVFPSWRGACQGTRTCQGGLTGDSRARVPTVVSSQGLHRQRDPEPGCLLTVMRERGMVCRRMGWGHPLTTPGWGTWADFPREGSWRQ